MREECDSLLQIFQALQQRHQKVLQKFAPERICEEFDREIDRLDDACENAKAKLSDGDVTPVQFIRAYSKLRSDFHVASVKKEKFNAQFG